MRYLILLIAVLFPLVASGKPIPLEPFGVIVLGIDGLRQDMLYNAAEASYYDQHGCGNNMRCFVEPQELNGLCEVLGGKHSITEVQSPWDPTSTYPVEGKCTYEGWENKHIKLPDVTAIFPSITFASWASIFSGKLPNETGILGNEFFARDLYNPDVPNNPIISGMNHLPSGMVTFSDGAFSSGGSKFALNHVTPVEFSLFGIYNANDTFTKKLAASAPNKALRTAPLWGDINSRVGYRYRVSPNLDTRCDLSEYECRTVSQLNQYTAFNGNEARPDLWGTPDSSWQSVLQAAASLGDTAKIMDKAAAGEAVDFIRHYFNQQNPDGRQKRFPALFSVYLSGLDHDAHDVGMENYRAFFMNTTDPLIKTIVAELKIKDEFDNKIFLITADHGHTAMPTDLKYKKTYSAVDLDGNVSVWKSDADAEMSCALKLDFGDDPDHPYAGLNNQNAERENNNLHIWELGEVMKEAGKFTGGNYSYRVLAPESIAALFSEEAYGARTSLPDANIIAALNGPMAHIYLTDLANLGNVAEMFRLTMQKEQIAEAAKWFNLSAKGYKDLRSSVGRLKFSIDQILVRQTDAAGNGDYCAFDGLNDDGSIRCATGNPFSSEEYVSAWDRINGMNHPKRSGDIVLLMKDVVNIPQSEPIENYRYTTGVACKSWHGSLNRSDSYVPFIFAYPGGNKSEMEKILQRETVCKADYSNCRGNWKLTDTVKEIISEQYK